MLFCDNLIQKLKRDPTIIVRTSVLNERMQLYTNNLSYQQFGSIVNIFGLDKRLYDSLRKLKDSAKNQYGFIRHILKEAYNMDYVVDGRGKNPKKAICIPEYNELIKTYGIWKLRVDNIYGYQFIEDEYCYE
jgi:hypothetical protein